MSENELRKQQVSGFYTDVELGPPGTDVTNGEIEKKERELDGTKKTGKNEPMYTLLECHVNLDLEGFEMLVQMVNQQNKITLHRNSRRR